MRLVFRCRPELEALLPRPVPARAAPPDWLRAMPAEAPSPTLGGMAVRTLKHCPPFLDALGLGVLMPLACNVTVADGAFSWDWDAPPLEGSRQSRAPIGVHVPEQAAGAPLGGAADGFVVKFVNFWTIEAPAGWSLLFTHPFNRPETPFRTLTGVVDCDAWADGHVHFPAVWTDPAFDGVLPRGLPVAQCVPVPRDRLDLVVETADAGRRDAQAALQDRLAEDPGVYRKAFRKRR